MDPVTNTVTIEGAAAAAPSAVTPAQPAAKVPPAAKAAPASKPTKAVTKAPTVAPAAAPAVAPAASAPNTLSGAPADAFEGLPQGSVFRRVGGRLVPVDRAVGTTNGTVAPGAVSVPPAGAQRVSPQLQQATAAAGMQPIPVAPARRFNPLFMAPPAEDAQVKSVINALQMSLRQTFSMLEHSIMQAGQALDYFAQSPAAAPALQAEGVDLQQVHEFVAAGSALLDQFAPPVAGS